MTVPTLPDLIAQRNQVTTAGRAIIDRNKMLCRALANNANGKVEDSITILGAFVLEIADLVKNYEAVEEAYFEMVRQDLTCNVPHDDERGQQP